MPAKPMAANTNTSGRRQGGRFSGVGPGSAALRAVVLMVVVTTTELFVTDGGLKLQDAAAGSPVQLNVIVPAAALPNTLNWNVAEAPAAIVALPPPEAMPMARSIFTGMVLVLLPGVTSVPPPETETLIEVAVSGADNGTLKVMVTLG